MPLAFNPRQRYLVGPGLGAIRAERRRRRLALGAFNPRIRYLRGLGQDDGEDLDTYEAPLPTTLIPYSASDAPDTAVYTAPISTQVTEPSFDTPYSLIPSSAAPGMITGTVNGAPAIVNSAGQVVAAVRNSAGQLVASTSGTNWLAQTNPTLGIPNSQIVLAGLGLLAAVLLASNQ
jgi:hypothetical protein